MLRSGQDISGVGYRDAQVAGGLRVTSGAGVGARTSAGALHRRADHVDGARRPLCLRTVSY